MKCHMLPLGLLGCAFHRSDVLCVRSVVQCTEEAALEEPIDLWHPRKLFFIVFSKLSSFSHRFDFHVRLGERIVVTEEKSVSCNVSGGTSVKASGLASVAFAGTLGVRVLGNCLWADPVHSVSRVVLLLNSQLVFRLFQSGVKVLRTVRDACVQWMGFFALNDLGDETLRR